MNVAARRSPKTLKKYSCSPCDREGRVQMPDVAQNEEGKDKKFEEENVAAPGRPAIESCHV